MRLADQDTYRTDPLRPRPLLTRLFLSRPFTFYPQLIHIIWRNGRKAKQGRYPSSVWASSSLDVLIALENVGARFEIDGMKNIGSFEGPAVFIGNHMSTLETFVLPSIIQPVKELTFVVKKSLVDMPLFGPVMRSRSPILVNRTSPREDLKTVLEKGTKKLQSGISVVIFPQSTRSAYFDPGQFNSLGIKLALKAGVPVVPVALKTDAWGTGKLIKDFGKLDVSKTIRFSFGAPMQVSGRGADEHQAVINFIRERLNAWQEEVTA